MAATLRDRVRSVVKTTPFRSSGGKERWAYNITLMSNLRVSVYCDDHEQLLRFANDLFLKVNNCNEHPWVYVIFGHCNPNNGERATFCNLTGQIRLAYVPRERLTEEERKLK